MKIDLHVPVEQYGFVNVNFETESDDYANISKEAYDAVADAFKVRPENILPTDEWNDFISKQLKGEKLDVNVWEQMSPQQKWCVNEIKKAKNRK